MPNASPDGPSILPRKDAAAQLGVTPQALTLWAKEPWFPPDAVHTDARGRKVAWNVAAIRAARAALGRGSDDAGRIDQITQQARAKKAVEDAKKAELENDRRRLALDEKRGRLVPRAALELFASTLLTGLGDKAEQFPDLAAAQLPRKHRRKLKDWIKQEFDAWRKQLAADLERAAREYDANQQSAVSGQQPEDNHE